MVRQQPAIIMEEVTLAPEERARAQAQRERFDRNIAWLQAHASDIYPRYRGKYICIAGEELFVAGTSTEAFSQAKTAHPEDDGVFLHYIRRDWNLRMRNARPLIMMTEVTDPEELARARAQDERFVRNLDWLRANASEVYSRHRGKFICIAGEELFVADTPEEVRAMAKAAHPEDNGRYVRYIPREKVARIYANHG